MAIDIVLAVATYPDATSRVGLGQALGLAARFGAGVSAMIQEVDIAPIHNAIGEALIGISQMALDAEGRWRLADEPMTDFPALRQALLASLAATEKPGLDLALDRHAPLSAFLDLMALLQQQGLDDTRILMEPSSDAP